MGSVGTTSGRHVDDAIFKTRLRAATDAVAYAERELEQALERLDRAQRADKTTISVVLSGAFEKLKLARAELTSVQALLSDDDDADDVNES
jgi:hypothetical protein